ncbi:hypothetical protein [Thiocapsa sp.]|uniref:hypothetical protein n=1 Tax=Thiocapsa sp. TaxID=2024551 RepID=UPI002C65A9BB|nr:hypothetical protein [Thiocapsa sp.]HSO81984.1 hypothetical protein [Thiocapsa sp.]
MKTTDKIRQQLAENPIVLYLIFINGEIIGGSDIIEAMLASGELLPMLKSAAG